MRRGRRLLPQHRNPSGHADDAPHHEPECDAVAPRQRELDALAITFAFRNAVAEPDTGAHRVGIADACRFDHAEFGRRQFDSIRHDRHLQSEREWNHTAAAHDRRLRRDHGDGGHGVRCVR